MKHLLYFSLLVITLFFTACGDDFTIDDAEFHYDGDNLSAPFLDAGIHEAAARFTATQTADFQTKTLQSVHFYLTELPAQCTVVVYGQGSATAPGTLLYAENVSNTITAQSWNTHVLTTPLAIAGEDLWIGLRVVHDVRMTSVGCDPGPANDNGDWLLSQDNSIWQSLRSRTGEEVDINWNIRGRVSEE